jgi:uncharacterized membrane protein (GlpM family)
MKIEFNISRLKESHWYEYVVRFIFGGCITAVAGLIAKHYGPAIGGLFLAFPAIFPATATLIEKHEKEKKKEQGKDGTRRARIVVGLDAIGTSIGAIALAVFAIIIWRVLPHSSLPAVLIGAMLAWMVTAWMGWMLWQGLRRRGRVVRQKQSKQACQSSLHMGPSTNGDRRMQ